MLPADAIVIGVGVPANTALAEGAGLTVDDGIVTDAACAPRPPTSSPPGDVANSFHPRYGRHLRSSTGPTR